MNPKDLKPCFVDVTLQRTYKALRSTYGVKKTLTLEFSFQVDGKIGDLGEDFARLVQKNSNYLDQMAYGNLGECTLFNSQINPRQL